MASAISQVMESCRAQPAALLPTRATQTEGVAQTMQGHRVLDLQFAQTFPHDLLFVREYTAGSRFDLEKIRCGHLIGKRAKQTKQVVPYGPSDRLTD